MNDYIDRQTAIAYAISGRIRTLNGAIKQLHDLGCAEDIPIYYKPVIAGVINLLQMDVQEVRHGYWQDGKCCICKADAPYTSDGFWDETAYCPSCGALMDKEEGTEG